ncbi:MULTISPECIES: precorrin-4 C(11)-methyltransferase [unclassified Lentimonas]|uniref:precorrin-4 C(11)-methyltransferase n=1 Tax=unclassified Lentimonas TaxID=2630993 RepID=UPI00132283FA|nr:MULTISPECIES: precorrin-4 C(11)-methyltransferase [unclassified Lentimonas]CAA6691584.1 Cobalt-precorrin-4 C11-methyltransferase (EC [Lentimonas sp. CC10]CAA6696254.1 Cobalt-precorrin-4 C11-methyltransferase (EC [Lentimonas sp. CC19]CAA7070861.1 Cobalt-precorrin-4 C11-methyltransferase (EC [Lentimonas sp. CC11]
MKKGTVTFCGAGPGAPDLLTLRAHRAIAEADVIVYAGSLVSPEVIAHHKPECQLHDSAGLNLDEFVQIMIDAARAQQTVLRLHTGDPSIYGATKEQMRLLDAADISYQSIPGITAAFAAAATLNAELTQPGLSQSVIISRRAGRTPVPEREALPHIGAIGATLTLYLSIGDIEGLVEELLASGGYTEQTPAAVVYRASWPDEKSVRGTLSTIAARVREAGITRQAIIMVGDVLSGEGEASLLYDRGFSHGYRKANGPQKTESLPVAETECAPFLRFGGRIAVYGLTQAGSQQALQLASLLDGTAYVSETQIETCQANGDTVQTFASDAFEVCLQNTWAHYDAHVFIMASGIVVRKVAQLLESKEVDPATLVMDEKANFVQSLTGGHLGGGNRLAQDIQKLCGAQAVISTASDTQGMLAFDEFAATRGLRIENRDSIVLLNKALLEQQRIALIGFTADEAAAFADLPHVRTCAVTDALDDFDAIVSLDTELEINERPRLALTRLRLVLGIGCKRGTPATQIDAAIERTCLRYGIDRSRIDHLVSAEIKHDEAGILELAARNHWQCHFLSAESLNQQAVTNPSEFVASQVGTPSVAEAGARVFGQGRLLAPKQKDDGVTVAVATMGSIVQSIAEPEAKEAVIYAIGIGPGTQASLTNEAETAIRQADWVVGYTSYCKQLEWLTHGNRVYSTGMRSEIERCDEAVRLAAEGNKVALVCSGDAGIYGMSGLIFERVAALGQKNVTVKVIAGVTSSSSAAAAIGAPLMNDFATISLSDLLTPREWIKKRIQAVAEAGLVCCLYNPRSRKRKALLDWVLETFVEHRGDTVPVALVRDAGRPKEWKWVGALKDIPIEEIGMTTMLIIGNESTITLDGYMVTKRGYEKKPSYAVAE